MTNPLQSYFRKPGMHLALLSKGRFNKVNFSPSGEISVLPMTAMDEIILNNPDSLLNGRAMIELIKSCCPDIEDPENLPMQDIDLLAFAIRMVSIKRNYDIKVKCPKCEHEFDWYIDINHAINEAKSIDFDSQIRLNDDLIVNIRPTPFKTSNKINLINYHEERILQNILSDELTPEEKVAKISASVEKVSILGLEFMIDCVDSILTPTGEVDNKEYIFEFLQNSPKEMTNIIRDSITHMNTHFGMPKSHTITCSECKHSWDQNLLYNPTDFFA